MSIFNGVKVEQDRHGHRRHDPFELERTQTLAYGEHATYEHRPVMGGAMQTKYILRLELLTSFWANPAQLERNRESAMKALAAELFRDVHTNLTNLTHYIVEGSREEALKVIAKMRKDITP